LNCLDRAQDAPASDFEFTNENEIGSLLATVKLKDDALPLCKCLGDMNMEFYEEEHSLGKISIHHGDKVRWNGGKWSGQFSLANASKSAIQAWLREHACPTIDEAVKACR